jgi:hypothetical protein
LFALLFVLRAKKQKIAKRWPAHAKELNKEWLKSADEAMKAISAGA